MAVHPPAAAGDLGWLLDNLMKNIHDGRSALLLSSDGLHKSSIGVSKEQTEHLAASVSGLFSLARSAGTMSGDENVRQVVIELDDGIMFICSAGSGAVLTVATGRDTNPGEVGAAMTTFIAAVKPFLETPERSSAV